MPSASDGGVKAAQSSGPLEYSPIRRDETVTFQCGRHDQSISGIGMKAGQLHGPDCRSAVDRDLHHALFEVVPSPGLDIVGQPDASLVCKHGHFPEGDRGHRKLVGLPCTFDFSTCGIPQSPVANPHPQQGVGV